MDLLGIPCTIVSAHNHAWNRVEVGGSWYHVDTTWDSTSSPDGTVRTTWFMRSDQGIQDQDIAHSSHYRNEGVITHSDYDASSEVHGTDTRFDRCDDAYWAGFWSHPEPLEQNKVTSFGLDRDSLRMERNSEELISVVDLRPSGANPTMAVWTSSNPDVAEVFSGGRVRVGDALGTAGVSCSIGGVVRSCNVRVAQDGRPPLASGTWGTCPWEIDADGALTVGAGRGADTGGECPWGGNEAAITSATFDEGVELPADCGLRCTVISDTENSGS